MNYWITTDTHFGHKKLVEEGVRPVLFEDIILKKLENTLTSGDILIHLGDVSFKDHQTWHFGLSAATMFCKQWLVKGNHDQHSDTWYLTHGWDFVAERIRINRFGADIVFSHIPIKDDGYELNIHGHFHNSDRRKCEPEMVAIANEKHVLVALELTNYMPINLKTLVKQHLRI